MLVTRPCVYVPANLDGNRIIKNIELAGRVCYKSEDRITGTSAHTFVSNIIKRGHESVLEHEKITVKFVCDRSVSHQIVRHRLASFSQESARYCNYSLDRFGGEITVVQPYFVDNIDAYDTWYSACLAAEQAYMDLIRAGLPAELARSVLPHSVKTELFVTANIREWRHIFKLRAAKSAYIELRRIVIPLLLHFRDKIPVLFDDIEYDTELPQSLYADVRLMLD